MKNIILKVLIAIKNKWFCCHQWTVFRETRVWDRTEGKPVEINYVLYCKKCGKFKKIKT